MSVVGCLALDFVSFDVRIAFHRAVFDVLAVYRGAGIQEFFVAVAVRVENYFRSAM